jgi:hypothetical protein
MISLDPETLASISAPEPLFETSPNLRIDIGPNTIDDPLNH